MAVSLTPTTLGALLVGTAFTVTAAGAGGTGPYTFAVSAGALPAGLSLNTSTGVINGTPTASGIYTFTLRATDSATPTPAVGTQVFSGVVDAVVAAVVVPSLAITPTTLGSLTVGSAISTVTLVGAGGTSPYLFSVSAQPPVPGFYEALSFANPGKLPAGLSLNHSTGAITGTPLVAGDFFFVIAAQDAAGNVGYQAFFGTVAASATQFETDPVADNFVSVTVAERISGSVQTGRLTTNIGGFSIVLQGGDTAVIPAFEAWYLRNAKVIS